MFFLDLSRCSVFNRKFRAILKLRRIFCPSPAMSCGGSGPINFPHMTQ